MAQFLHILQIVHYPVWPFQACALEASPGKQNMLKWVLIHPGRVTHRGTVAESVGERLANPPWTIASLCFQPHLNWTLCQRYTGLVWFSKTLNPNVRTFTEPFPPRHSPQLITGQIIDRFGENIQTFQKWDSESSCLNILLQRSHTLVAVTNTKFISWGKYSILELF